MNTDLQNVWFSNESGFCMVGFRILTVFDKHVLMLFFFQLTLVGPCLTWPTEATRKFKIKKQSALMKKYVLTIFHERMNLRILTQTSSFKSYMTWLWFLRELTRETKCEVYHEEIEFIFGTLEILIVLWREISLPNIFTILR